MTDYISLLSYCRNMMLKSAGRTQPSITLYAHKNSRGISNEELLSMVDQLLNEVLGKDAKHAEPVRAALVAALNKNRLNKQVLDNNENVIHVPIDDKQAEEIIAAFKNLMARKFVAG